MFPISTKSDSPKFVIQAAFFFVTLFFVHTNNLFGQDFPMADTTVVTCGGYFWDEGLDKTYSDSEYVMTFRSAAGMPLLLNFYIFKMRPGTGTFLHFYDGPDTNAPSLGIFGEGTDYPTSIISTGQFLTVRKTIGFPPVPNDAEDFGWKARIGCISIPENVHFRGISIPELKEDLTSRFTNIAVADYDLDGDEDMVVRDTLYRNDTPSDEGFHLTERRNAFGRWANAAPAVADFDMDGDLDVFICGWRNGVNSFGSKTILYEQTDIDQFRPVNFSFANASEGKAAALDFDKDGDIDIAYTGNTSNGLIFKMYKNNGNFTFSDATPAGIVGARNCGFDWSDVDADGDWDFVIGGQTDGQADGIRLYKNNGSGQFTAQSLFMPTFFDLDLRFFDYDSDGDKDLYVGDFYKKIYKNTGGNFVALHDSIPFLFTATNASNFFPADYDNDGDEDALLTNLDSVRLYRNDGNAIFTQIQLSQAVRGEDTEAAWGDFNADGRLDFFVQGFGGVSLLFLNKGNDVFEKTGGSVTGFVEHPRCVAADFDGNGTPEILNVGLQYLCGGEGFPRIHIFELTNNETAVNKHPVFRPAASFPEVSNFGKSVWEWGDYDNDGRPDLLVHESNAAGITSKIFVFKNNDNGSFSKKMEADGGYPYGSAAWVDFDKDGDLDVYVGAGIYPIYYRNMGNSQFVQFQSSNSDPAFEGSEVFRSSVWTDLDADGDKDLVEHWRGSLTIRYNDGTGRLLQSIYPALNFYGERLPVADFNNDNQPDCLFANQFGASVLDSIRNRNYLFGKMPRFDRVALGDFNYDGWMDYAWPTAVSLNEESQMTIWLNQSNFFFKADTLDLTHIFYNQSDHGTIDFDDDGDLDLVTFNPILCHDFSFAQNVSNQARQLKMVYPNGGEQLLAGSQTTVSWSGNRLKDNAATSVSLSYSLNGGLTFTDLGEVPTTQNGGSYLWNVPDSLSKTCLYRVKSAKNSLVDQSDFFFEITDFIGTSTPKNEMPTISVFPNPLQHSFWITSNQNWDTSKLTLFNAFGQMVFSKNLSGILVNKPLKMEIGDLPAGIYFLKLEDGRRESGEVVFVF